MEAPGQLQIYVKDSVTSASRSGLSIEAEDDEVSVRKVTKYAGSSAVPRFMPIFAGHNDNRNFVLRITVAGLCGTCSCIILGLVAVPSKLCGCPSSLLGAFPATVSSHRAISSRKCWQTDKTASSSRTRFTLPLFPRTPSGTNYNFSPSPCPSPLPYISRPPQISTTYLF
jgi:hypothetical protein